jgi:hypothetical protein
LVAFQALIEQVSYGPFAMVSFFFFMSILEGRGVQAAKQEVADKFWATYKVRYLNISIILFFIVNFILIYRLESAFGLLCRQSTLASCLKKTESLSLVHAVSCGPFFSRT